MYRWRWTWLSNQHVGALCTAGLTVCFVLGLGAAGPIPALGQEAPRGSTEPGRLAAPVLTNSLGMEFHAVRETGFFMGSPESDPDRRADEMPRHEVNLTQFFYMGTTEVTVGQFRAFVEDVGYVTEAEQDVLGGWIVDPVTGEARQEAGVNWRSPGFAQADDHPVVQVSWVDAEAFCRWLIESEGGFYRLPTEAEWERCCRAGAATRYGFGDDAEGLREQANVADASLREVFPAATWAAPWNDGAAFTRPVAHGPANPLGLFDMHGNVWEWCADWHSPTYYAQAPATDPKGPENGTMRAIRGGGWFDPPERARCATRAWFEPVFRYCQLSGFRVVRTLVPSE